MNISDVFADQAQFMSACDQTLGTYNAAQYKMYVKLIDEEVQELHDAINDINRIEQLDALIDIMVVTIGALHSLGVDGRSAWQEVMRTNFAKIDTVTGKVRKREDGKVLKPEGWQAPRLDKFV